MSGGCRRRRVTLALSILAMSIAGVVTAAPAPGGLTGVFLLYEKGPEAIPNGSGAARLKFQMPAEDTAGVSAGVRVRHPRTQQLEISLKSPNGEVADLTRHDTRGENLGAHACPDGRDPEGVDFTEFSDNASEETENGMAPYLGVFLPRQPIAPLTGSVPEGHWTLIVRDTKGGADGKLLCGLVRVPLAD